jgi:sugar/nucleoside kinase (ribokinase family)
VPADILCIGSVLWDIIGRSPLHMQNGDDKPGHICRQPGGVALNIALTLRKMGVMPALLSVTGQDAEGRELRQVCADLGLIMDYSCIDAALPTDIYMAIEAQGDLVAAIADAHSLESAGDRILAPLVDGRLGSCQSPWAGLIALDGNLTENLLAQIAKDPCFAKADLRVAPASPGKATRLCHLLHREHTTFYVNCIEAGLITGQSVTTARQGAMALRSAGVSRVIVTDGSRAVVDATQDDIYETAPPKVTAHHITGAGDTFMAAHIAGEQSGMTRQQALDHAAHIAARFVSGENIEI